MNASALDEDDNVEDDNDEEDEVVYDDDDDDDDVNDDDDVDDDDDESANSLFDFTCNSCNKKEKKNISKSNFFYSQASITDLFHFITLFSYHRPHSFPRKTFFV